MKFETYVHKIVLDIQTNFDKDPCKDERTRYKRAPARFIASAGLHLVRADLYENLVGGQVLSYEHKFQIS